MFAKEGRASSAPVRDGTAPCNHAVDFDREPYGNGEFCDNLPPCQHIDVMERNACETSNVIGSDLLNATAPLPQVCSLESGTGETDFANDTLQSCPALQWYDMVGDFTGDLHSGGTGIGMDQSRGHAGLGGCLTLSQSDNGCEDTAVSNIVPSFVQNPDLGPEGFLLLPAPPPPLRSPPLPPRLASPALPVCVGGSVGAGGCSLFPS